ncbi:MAG: glycoside hydrolase [Bacteroidetes bacterium HGW-Bacteroidetes-1]|jgi:cell wall-associated NlpC family hydrolase|nr:MAG: glycoside hydrolase [Bacteroidetes bacterium HGW-Bacteroidetes-1]
MFKIFIITILIVLFGKCNQSQTDIPIVEPEIPKSIVVDNRRSELIAFAKNYLGTTYQYASVNPGIGFDCSGFVYFVFQKNNIVVPRTSREYKNLGTSLKHDEFRIGDVLVFYGYLDTKQIGHVGIICEANGMKSKFIHASSGKPYGVTISDLDSEMYSRRFYKCIDVMQ